MSDLDPRRYLLSEQDSRRRFLQEIVPKAMGGASPVADPVVVFVAGQPGAGKTRTEQAVLDALADQGSAVVVDSDIYKPFHPAYRRLLEQDDRTAAPYTSLDGRRWMAMAQDWLIEHRMNALITTTMRDRGDFLTPAQTFRAAGYRVEAVMLAVPAAQSRLGILARYVEQVRATGHGRLTETTNHDASYTGVQTAAAAIDRDRLVDAVAIYRRGNVLVYENHLDPHGNWTAPARAAERLTAERERPWTADEANDFHEQLHLVEHAGLTFDADLQAITALARPHLTPSARHAPHAQHQTPWPTRPALHPRTDPPAGPPRPPGPGLRRGH